VFNSAHRSACRAARHPAAALLATAALLAAAAPAAQAAEGDGDEEAGTASASVLRAGLTVSLLNGTAELPLDVTLNDVASPSPSGSAEETLLTARLDGVEGGQPFQMLSADVASAEATTDADGSRAESSLVNATVHLPGLPLLSLIEVEAVTASAVCAEGEAPTAESNLGANVRVLGEDVTVRTEGSTTVEVPGVGQVTLDLSQSETTDTTAAATALGLSVSVDPLDLGVAAVDGEVTLVEAECQTPGAAGPGDGASDGADGGAGSETGEGPSTQTGDNGEAIADDEADLAETGGGSSAPYVAGGALALVAAGGATMLLVRRRSATRDGATS
jgi:hypothetical protein